MSTPSVPSPVPAGTERAAVWMQALGDAAPDVWAVLTPRQRGAVAEALMPVADAEAAVVVSSSPATPEGGRDRCALCSRWRMNHHAFVDAGGQRPAD